MSWSNPYGAVRYEIWVDNVSTRQSKVLHHTDLSNNVFTAQKHLAAGQYRFWVRAFSKDGRASTWSKSADFRIEAPSMPEFTSSMTTETLAWTTSENAVRYELWVNNPTTGESRVIHETDLTDITFRVSNRLKGGEYRAWVRAFNAAGDASAWSIQFVFKVPGEQGPPVA